MRQLGMFAKFWAPGQVKTRLAATLGLSRQCSSRRFLSKRCWSGLREWPIVGQLSTPLRIGLSRSRPWRAMDGTWRRKRRGISANGCGAGSSLHSPRGPDAAVLIGSDSPTLPASFIESAFELLREYDAVLGPADDGGYYLVGIARPTPPIFEGMIWSQPTVWGETVARLEAADWRYAALPRWYDVDEWEDLLRLHAELTGADASDSALARLKRAVAQAVAARRSAEAPQ